jgi:hypothetical protein
MYQGNELITPREIIIITIVSVLGPCWRGCRGYLGSWGLIPRRGGRHDVCPGDAKHFANVHVGAIRVQLGVIVREEGCVHIVGRGHNVAIVIGLHHVRSRAIVARSPQAQGLARKEVRTIRVDPRVYDRKLIGGHVVGS